MSGQPIYLDYAAATPLDPVVFAAMQPYLTDQFYNPSATYRAAQSVHKDLEAARVGVAHWLGAKPSEIIFTAGGTEANNLALKGIMDAYPDGNLVVSAIEHESVLKTAALYAHRLAPVDAAGVLTVGRLLECIDDTTVLISVMYANNEVGTIQSLRAITAAVAKVRAARLKAGNHCPLYVHTDAAQAAAYLDLHVARLGVDLLTINAGKIYGPKQVGVLYAGSHVRLTPQVLGGGQERGLRSGTENVAGAVGMRAALDAVQERRHDEVRRLQGLQSFFVEQLEARIPSVIINGSRKLRLPNNVHVTFPGADNERLLFALDERGIQCAAGSACTADSGEPSHVLKAMGMPDTAARASLRFTMGRHTTKQQVTEVVQRLVSILTP